MACEHGMTDSAWCSKCIAAAKDARRAQRKARNEMAQAASKAKAESAKLGEPANASGAQISDHLVGNRVIAKGDWRRTAAEFIDEWCVIHDKDDRARNTILARIPKLRCIQVAQLNEMQHYPPDVANTGYLIFMPRKSADKVALAGVATSRLMTGRVFKELLEATATTDGTEQPVRSITTDFAAKYDGKCQRCPALFVKGDVTYGSVLVGVSAVKPTWICATCALAQRFLEESSFTDRFMPKKNAKPKTLGQVKPPSVLGVALRTSLCISYMHPTTAIEAY